ncbi:MAG: hypothetical protein H0W07_09925 [Chloroflexi bacterium]|nr:hypothetical protein [Chloroflexota bacterium]
MIEPAFGVLSLEAHVQAAADVEATLLLVVDSGLGFDLDTPEDVDRLGVETIARLVRLGSLPVTAIAREPVTAEAAGA